MQNKRKYEINLLLRQEVSMKEVDDLISFMKSVFEKNDISIVKEENWGVRSLAYPIKGNTSATYLSFEAEGPSESLKELEIEIKLEQSIIRYYINQIKEFSEQDSYLAQTAEMKVTV